MQGAPAAVQVTSVPLQQVLDVSMVGSREGKGPVSATAPVSPEGCAAHEPCQPCERVCQHCCIIVLLTGEHLRPQQPTCRLASSLALDVPLHIGCWAAHELMHHCQSDQ